MSDQDSDVSHRQQLDRIIVEYMRDDKRLKIWQYAFRVLLALLVGFYMWVFSVDRGMLLPLSAPKQGHGSYRKDHVALIRVHGEISAQALVNAEAVINAIRDVVKNKHAKAIILDINSPGGSPVQAAYMYQEIQRVRKEHHIKVYAVCSDLCASAAYYIAAASDKVYANPSSLVGSIGVLMDGFGFPELMKKIGVERRLYTAGSNKGMLDPFSPAKVEDEQTLAVMLHELHQEFIRAVKEGRGKRLKSHAPEIFSGRFWTGIGAKSLGLIDDYANTFEVAKNVVGIENMVDYTPNPGVFDQLFGTMGSKIFHGFKNSAQQPWG